MYKWKRFLIITCIRRRRCRPVLALAALACCGLWAAPLWRERVGGALSLAPPLDERDLGYLRRSRSLETYLDDITLELITPDAAACEDSAPLVALVSSAPGHAEQRAAIRSTWGAEVTTFFFLGRSGHQPHRTDPQLIENYMEARQHGDLVVGDYVDTYENLTLKTSHAVRWASERCARARYVLKTDDDVLVNPWVLGHVLSERVAAGAGADAGMIGYMRNGSAPHRDKENKWYLPRWLYREDSIPEYLSGTGYLITGEHLENIHRASLKVPLINLEDVYLTYLVAKKQMHLNLTHEPRLSPYRPLVSSACAVWRLASVHSLQPSQIRSIWPGLRALAEQYAINEDPCRVFNWFFGFLSWEWFLV